MLHFYLQKGITPDKLINLPDSDKQFYKASMALALDEEATKY